MSITYQYKNVLLNFLTANVNVIERKPDKLKYKFIRKKLLETVIFDSFFVEIVFFLICSYSYFSE